MKFLVISGIDGSGKTSIINELQRQLQQKGYNTFYIWLRYNHYLITLLNGLARLLGLSVRTMTKRGMVWQHRFYKSHLFCNIYILCSYIDNIFAKRKIKFISQEYDYVVCDRWINDILIDLGTKSHRPHFLETKWYNRFQHILPDGSIQYLISRNKELVLECREENIEDPDFQRRFELYEGLALKPNVEVIDNNGSIEDSVLQIINKINLLM